MLNGILKAMNGYGRVTERLCIRLPIAFKIPLLSH
jgi:hypothetical protein